MRLGIHISHQREIVKFLQARLRPQFWAMLALALATVSLAALFAFKPVTPPEGLAVALVRTGTASGSGFPVSQQLVVTSGRLVANYAEVSVEFPTLRGNISGAAKVLFADPEHDVALIQLNEVDPSLRPMVSGNSDALGEREEIIIAGFPAESYQSTPALVMRKNLDTLETSAQPDPGLAGAPVMRQTDGTVVGMVTAAGDVHSRLRAITINAIERICRDRQNPIR